MARMQAEGRAVAVRMLGPLRVRAGERTLGPGDLGGVKPKQLLELLLLERGRGVPKDRLADLLWGDRLPRRVAATIETYVSVLRGRLDGGSGLGRRLIVTERGGYRVAADAVDADLDRFEALLQEAASAGAPAARRAALEAALELAREDLLADEPYAEWAIAPREHLRARRAQALVDLAECRLDLDDHAAALAAAEDALALEPTGERAHRVAMLAHYARGELDPALRAHVRCRAALAEELGVSPTARIAELHVAMLRGDDARLLLGRSSAVAAPAKARPPVAYTGSGVRIAYQTVGAGPPDLVFVPSAVSNLATTWDDPTYAAFLGRLAAIGRLILFDKRGTGLSDPAFDGLTARARSEDILAVLDAAGSERAVLFGVCGGGALCAHFAADHPDRTAGLVLHNSLARTVCDADYPWGLPPERYQALLDGFEAAWLSGTGQERRNPGLADNPRYRDWFARYVRLGVSPWMGRRLVELNAEIDLRPLLGDIRSPCLVICRTEDAWLSPENSRYLATRIPGARLLELPGVDHDPWVGDTEPVLAAVESFVDGVTAPPAPVAA